MAQLDQYQIDQYQKIVRQLLMQYATGDVVEEGVETQIVCDSENHHYYWMNVGWNGNQRVYDSIMHFDIREGKVWIQQNLTEADPAEDLVELGVAKEDIVLGLHPPYKRPFTGYGVA
jgi:XisI protein